MMVIDADWLTFEGDPVIGRNSAKVIVQGNVALSRAQMDGVKYTYQAACQGQRVSLANYSMQYRQLADGTRIRIEHNGNAGDRVFVYPPDPEAPLELASLFFAVPTALGGLYTPNDPKYSDNWRFRGATDSPSQLQPARIITDATGIRQHPGNLTWWSDAIKVNGKPLIVSWYGRATRYGRLDYYGHHRQVALGSVAFAELYNPVGDLAHTNWEDALKPAVWTNGVKHAVQKIVAGSPVAMNVMSAAMKKDSDGRWLYIVNDTSPLSVWRGQIDPYSNVPVTVTHLFDVDFTIDSTAYSVGQPFWETLLQPLYFNASCTACAGLVVVQAGSAVNTTAAAAFPASGVISPQFEVGLIQVDLVGMTTAFDSSHASVRNEAVTDTHTGAPDFSGGSPPYSAPTEARSYVYETEYTRYGAVDWQVDSLRIAMASTLWHSEKAQTGAYSVPAVLGDDATASRDESMTVNHSYRVFYAHDSSTLATKTTGTLSIGTTHTESNTHYDEDAMSPTFGFIIGTASGTRSETISDPLYVMASVEGGDLRHDCVVVGEFLEVGTSSYADNIAPSSADMQAWSAYSRVPHSGYPQFIDGLTRTATTDSRARQPALRFSVWQSAVEFDTCDYLLLGSGERSAFGQLFDLLTIFHSDAWWTFTDGGPTVTTSDFDPMPEFDAFGTASPFSLWRFSPLINVGYPYINTVAFAPDGTYWFYNVASSCLISGFTVSYPAHLFPKAEFVINGTKHAPDTSIYMPTFTPQDPVLASPIFLDNVPTE